MKASAEALTLASSQKSKTGGLPAGPSAIHDDQPSVGRRAFGAPVGYACARSGVVRERRMREARKWAAILL